MRAELRVLAVLATALAVVAGCGGEERPIRIGLLTDCRGLFAGFEDAMLAGAELPLLRRGAELEGTAPGEGISPARVAGREVELVRGCSEAGEHTVLIEEARRLIDEEQVDAIAGGVGDSDGLVLREVALRYPDVAFVPTWSGAQELTLHEPAPNLYRFETDLSQDVAGLGAYAYRDLGWRRAAVLADPFSVGWGEEAAFVAEFCSLGGEVVTRIPVGAIDPSGPELKELAESVDGVAVLASAFSGPGPLLTRLAESYEKPAQSIVVGRYVVDDDTLVGALAESLAGVVGASPTPVPGSTDETRALAAEFAAAFPSLPASVAFGPITLAFHDEMEGLLQGLEAADGDPSRLSETLADLRVEVPSSPIRLDGNGQAVRSTYLKRIGSDAAQPTLEPVRTVPEVEQTFGGLLSAERPPGPGSQPCRTATPPPWAAG